MKCDYLQYNLDFFPRAICMPVSSMHFSIWQYNLGITPYPLQPQLTVCRLGMYLEREWGSFWFLVTYFISGVAGTIFSCIMQPATVGAGATGAVAVCLISCTRLVIDIVIGLNCSVWDSSYALIQKPRFVSEEIADCTIFHLLCIHLRHDPVSLCGLEWCCWWRT